MGEQVCFFPIENAAIDIARDPGRWLAEMDVLQWQDGDPLTARKQAGRIRAIHALTGKCTRMRTARGEVPRSALEKNEASSPSRKSRVQWRPSGSTPAKVARISSRSGSRSRPRNVSRGTKRPTRPSARAASAIF